MSIERMCPCNCGMTFDEAVVTLIDDGDTREKAVEFLNNESYWKERNLESGRD